MGLVDNRFEDNVLTTTVDSVINWARRLLDLADAVRAGLLRDRDDGGHGRPATTWRGSARRSSGARRGSRT
mgnify:CR=1 FL=1